MFNEMADILTTNIDKLKEVENLRRELIANVSHDLRTPLYYKRLSGNFTNQRKNDY
jgi:signal transduction histidine kinase